MDHSTDRESLKGMVVPLEQAKPTYQALTWTHLFALDGEEGLKESLTINAYKLQGKVLGK